MTIKEIDQNTFNSFSNNHILKNFFQTKEYASLMTKTDFKHMYIGYYENDILSAASLILYKTIGPNIKYGYAPRGFILDYYNDELLRNFTKKIKDFFFLKGFAFIKINPEITYSIIDFNNKSKTINARNKRLVKTLKELGYIKIKDALYFESVLPQYTPVINLKNYNINELEENIKDNASLCEKSGVKFIKGNLEKIEVFYNFIKNKKNKDIEFYKQLYSSFENSDMIDLLLLEINWDIYIKFLQKQYIYETTINEEINSEFHNNPQDMALFDKKMQSDKTVSKLNTEIANINKRVNDNLSNEIIGGAFIVKHQGRITILITGNSKDYKSLDLKSYMFYKIIEKYQNEGYKFIDLYGITADYTDSNPYKKLNEFKIQFKPIIYEYIGEFDLIINKAFHQILWSTNKIQKEFYKPIMQNELNN